MAQIANSPQAIDIVDLKMLEDEEVG